MTYAEKRGREPFDWNAFLNQKSGDISSKDWVDAENKASSWVTCACGNLCDVIPRDTDFGCPNDSELRELGIDFYGFIGSRNQSWAKITLEKIEARSAELLEQIHASTPGN